MVSHKDKKTVEIIKDEFKASYYPIQRSGLRKRTGKGREQNIAKAKKNRGKTNCWSTFYSNCSTAGLFKETLCLKINFLFSEQAARLSHLFQHLQIPQLFLTRRSPPPPPLAS